MCGTSGGRLILSSTNDPKSFNPIVAKETSTTQITGLLFEGLVTRDPLTLEILPRLAQKWKTADGKVWTFSLRRGVKWSDGKEFTADDVVFTFNDLIYNPDIPTSSRDIFTIEGEKIVVEKVDTYTVRFRLPSVFAPFLESLAHEILPEHIYGPMVTSGTFTFSMGLDSNPSGIVGCGPFRLKKYLPGERVVLERNPFYWRKDSCGRSLPYLDEIIFVVLANQDRALLKFMESEIDYYSLRPQDIAILGKMKTEGDFTIYNTGTSFTSDFVVLNQNPGTHPHTQKPFVLPYKLKWFQNVNFRKSISYAINRKKIIDVVFQGLAGPRYSCVSPANTLFYNPEITQYPYDPQKARRLLGEMGFADRDQDGILEDQEGHTLEMTFFTNNDSTERIQIATLIKKDLEDIGMRIYFLPLNFNNLVTKLISSFDWEMILIGLTGGIEPHFGKNVWSYTGVLHMWNPTKTAVYEWEKEIEDIFNQGVRILDHTRRKKLYDRWQKIVSEELPVMYTVTGESIFAVKNRLGNVYPTVLGGAFPEIERVFIREE